jgi:hypothetical protein
VKFSTLPIGLAPNLEQRNPSLAYRVAFDALCAIRRYRNSTRQDGSTGGQIIGDAERTLAGKCASFQKAGVAMADPDAQDEQKQD